MPRDASRGLSMRPKKRDEVYARPRDDSRSTAAKSNDYDMVHVSQKKAIKESPMEGSKEKAGVFRRIEGEPAWDDLVTWLRDLDSELVSMKETPPMLQRVVTLNKDSRPHHWTGAALCVRSLKSRFKGVILADPPGMGKTLIPLLAACRSHKKGDPPSVAIMPTSTCRGFEQEVPGWFPENALNHYRLEHGYMSPEDLAQYKLIITSFDFIQKEYERLQKFVKARQEYDCGTSLIRPKPPRLSLLTTLLTPESQRKRGNYLIIDEAHTLKNVYSPLYAAVKELRECYTSCLLLTATPFDNSWLDSFALFGLLKGHPITDLHRMREAFSPTYKRKVANYDAIPEGKYLARLQQMMQATTIVRPNVNDLPEMKEYILPFSVSKSEVNASNRAFEGFGGDEGKKGPASTTENAKLMSLIKAEQLVFHPALVEVAGLERAALKKSLSGDDEEDPELDDHERKFLESWKADLRRDKAWSSPRVDLILKTIASNIRSKPDDGILVLDESVYFLDILEIAIGTLRPKIACFRMDGRISPDLRTAILQKFEKQYGPRVMLASRHTAGQGINVHHAANILIRCGPWWRSSWEVQANGRIHRHGQKKPMKVYEIQETSVEVERYKMKVRDRNGEVNTSIIGPITLGDNEPLEPPRNIR